MSRRILILFVHPAMEKSRVNRQLIAAVKNLENVTVHDLYEDYPDGFIDVNREQQALRDHDVIVWQHPFFWYSSPSLLKEWQDLVLTYGFAFGTEDTELKGKKVMTAITTGGSEVSYHPECFNRFTIRQLLAPFEQTSNLCGMEYLEPFVIHDALDLTNDQIAVEAERYRKTILALRDTPSITPRHD
jgi:glutathione-regulated potassium-efflux system ancillary protein KefG